MNIGKEQRHQAKNVKREKKKVTKIKISQCTVK